MLVRRENDQTIHFGAVALRTQPYRSRSRGDPGVVLANPPDNYPRRGAPRLEEHRVLFALSVGQPPVLLLVTVCDADGRQHRLRGEQVAVHVKGLDGDGGVGQRTGRE
jgi:hypothetical protein